MKQDIVINTRCLSNSVTGVQRYTLEIYKRLTDSLGEVKPNQWHGGVKGHIWEQVVLPNKLSGKLLWSPANTGPLQVRNQVLTIHDISPLEHPEWMRARFVAWYQWLIPKLANRVTHIFADSEYTKLRIQEVIGISPDKIEVVYPGVEIKKLENKDGKSNENNPILGIPFPHYILSLCSLEPRKNLSRLLHAWDAIVDFLPEDVGLVLAGGKGKSQVFKSVGFDKLPKRVYSTGYIYDDLLPKLYSDALFFVYVSMYEGFGLPPLEAMSYNVPVIAGNLTSIPEVVGDAGILVDPFDVDAISENIISLFNDEFLRNTLKRKGAERAKLFTWDEASRKIMNRFKIIQSS